MKLHDREVRLAFNVGAMQDIAQLCPGKDIRNMDQLFDLSDESKPFDFGLVVKMVAILSKWGERQYQHEQKLYDNIEYTQQPFTEDELNLLQPAEIQILFAEVMETMRADGKQTVETEPEKKGKKE